MGIREREMFNFANFSELYLPRLEVLLYSAIEILKCAMFDHVKTNSPEALQLSRQVQPHELLVLLHMRIPCES